MTSHQSKMTREYLCSEVSVGEWIQELIKSFLVEFLVLFFLNFFWIPHLQFITGKRGLVLSHIKKEHNIKNSHCSQLTHIGFVSFVNSQSQYFSVLVFFVFFFSSCHYKRKYKF